MSGNGDHDQRKRFSVSQMMGTMGTTLANGMPRRGPRPPSTRPPSVPWAKKKRGPRPPSTNIDARLELANVGSVGKLVKEEEEENETKSKKKGMAAKVGKQIKKKHACERAFTCALAVSLLWLTSLGMSQALVTYFVPTPSVNNVVDNANRLFSETKTQRQRYEQCAIGLAGSCRNRYEATLSEELLLVNQTQEFLESRLDEYVEELFTCSDQYFDAIDVLKFIEIDLRNFRKVGADEEFCTDAKLSNLLGSEAAKLAATSSVREYKQVANARTDELDSDLEKRAAYDLEYANNKTGGMAGYLKEKYEDKLMDPQAIVDQTLIEYRIIMACTEISGSFEGQVCPEQPSKLGKAHDFYVTSVRTYNETQRLAALYKKEAEEKMEKFRKFYDTLLDVVDAISVIDFDVSSYEPPAFFVDIQSYLDEQIESITESPRELAEVLREEGENFERMLNEEGGLIQTAKELAQGNTTGFTNNLFSDYDPPEVEGDDFDDSSDSIVAQVTASLGTSVGGDDAPPLTEYVADQQLNVTEESANLLEKANPRTWEFFQYEDSVFEQLSVGFTSVNDYALILDYSYRILKSLMLIRKYWLISAVSTPPADVRCDAGISAGMFSAKKNCLQMIGYWLTHPLINFLLILLFFGFFSITFYSAYEPLYSEYTSNCIDECWTGITNDIMDDDGVTPIYPATANGTMIYRNAYAIAEQYAFTDGDYVASTQVESLNVERELACKDNVLASIERELNQDETYNFYNDRMTDIVEKVSVVRQCVDIAKIAVDRESDITSYVVTNPNISFVPGTFEANEAICSSTFTDLNQVIANENSDFHRVFDCTAIESCDFTCNGPNESVLRSTTHSTTCTIEWFVHASTLGAVMTTTVYIVLNLSRYVLMRGLVKVFWRHLVNSRFSYLASCTESGKVIYPEAVTEKGESFGSVIMAKLRVALGSFEREGMIEVFFALAINAPWIAILVILQQRLAFDSSKTC